MLVTSFLLSNLGPQGIMDTLPDTGIAPAPEIAIDPRPVREIMRHQPPLNPTHGNRQKGIDDFAHMQFSMPSTRLFWRNQVFDTIPLLVSEVG
jgi:hypothetical protein